MIKSERGGGGARHGSKGTTLDADEEEATAAGQRETFGRFVSSVIRFCRTQNLKLHESKNIERGGGRQQRGGSLFLFMRDITKLHQICCLYKDQTLCFFSFFRIECEMFLICGTKTLR